MRENAKPKPVNTGVIMAVVIRAVMHAHITNIVDPFIVLMPYWFW